MKKQRENSPENITWSEMGKQNVQAKEVYSTAVTSPFSSANVDLGTAHCQETVYDPDNNLG